MKIGMTSVFVHDPTKAFAFYTDVLGFAEHTYLPEHNLAIVVSPEAADGVGLLLEPNDNPIARTYQQGLYEAGLPAIVFAVDNMEHEYARLVAAGVQFRSAPETSEWGTSAVFDDGFGNWIQLHQQ